MIYKKKSFWTVFVIILLIVTLLATVGWYRSNRLEGDVRATLEHKISELTNGFYRLEIDRMQIALYERNIHVKGITLKPDSAMFARLQKHDSLPDHYADIYIASLRFQGTHFVWNKKMRSFSLDKILVDSPDVKLVKTPEKERHDSSKKSPKTLHQVISGILDEINVSDITISNGALRYLVAQNNGDTLSYVLKNLNFHAEQFNVDSLSDKSNKLFYCENISFQVENLDHVLPGKAYTLSFRKINLDVRDSALVMDKMELIPNHSKYEFSYKVENHSDWTTTTIEGIECSGVNFDALLNNKSLIMRKMQLKNADHTSFKNRKIIVEPCYKPLLFEYLQHASTHINIKEIAIKNGNITYEELPKEKNVTGKIYFTEINGRFRNFTNNIHAPNQHVTFNTTAKLMGEGKMNVTFIFPVNPHNDHFEFRGTVQKMDLKTLNAIFEPLANAKLESGMLNSFEFDMQASSHSATVDMTFLYNSLHVAILHEKNDEFVKWGLASTAANLLIKSNNPDKEDALPRTATTAVERNPERSMFDYIWKSILPGLVETIGISEKKQETFHKKAEKQKEKKASRETKKEDKKIKQDNKDKKDKEREKKQERKERRRR